MAALSYKAKSTLLPDFTVAEGLFVTVEDGVITNIGSRPLGRTVDLGDAILMPGLVNAHTHLEFSLCEAPIGQPQMSFAEWVGQVIAYRINEFTDDPMRIYRAIEAGIAESVSAGVTSIGEITTCEDLSVYHASAANVVSFRELLGTSAERELQQQQRCNQHCTAEELMVGISPHATYTVSPSLFQFACRATNRHHLPLAIHLAETREELTLIESRSGRLYERLCELDAWNESAYADVNSLDAYLEILKTANKSLIVHGNYLSNEQFDRIAQFKDKTSMVYCPRTHEYFAHDKYPIAEILKREIPMCLATDSRSSNPDLNLWRELTSVRHRFPDISTVDLLMMVTSNPAKALGISKKTGCIAVGMRADLLVAHVEQWDGSLEHLTESPLNIESVLIHGKQQLK